MIARVWLGVTQESKAEEYLGLKRTGLSDYQKIQGNKGAHVLKRAKDGLSEFVLISFWESIDAIRQFAGEDYERAVYYPQDKDYLISFEGKVEHYDVPYTS